MRSLPAMFSPTHWDTHEDSLDVRACRIVPSVLQKFFGLFSSHYPNKEVF
jgi:hypothetical protein